MKLQELTEENEVLADHQFGFRKEYSTVQQIIRIVEDVADKVNISTPTPYS